MRVSLDDMSERRVLGKDLHFFEFELSSSRHTLHVTHYKHSGAYHHSPFGCIIPLSPRRLPSEAYASNHSTGASKPIDTPADKLTRMIEAMIHGHQVRVT